MSQSDAERIEEIRKSTSLGGLLGCWREVYDDVSTLGEVIAIYELLAQKKWPGNE